MLAFNAFLITLFILLLLGAVLMWFLGRPLGRFVNKTCDQIDEEQEAKARRERLEKEEEARAKAQAEQEVEEQFPNLREGGE